MLILFPGSGRSMHEKADSPVKGLVKEINGALKDFKI
jgi:hypothetical protein